MDTRGELYTHDEFRTIQSLPENGDRILELYAGEIIEKMSDFAPSAIASTISFYFKKYLLDYPVGYVTGKGGGYRISEDFVFNPDVGYITKSRLPHLPAHEAPVAPSLAIEIRSTDDRGTALREKAAIYLQSGTRLVWLVFPREQVVEVHKQDAPLRIMGIDSILDGEDVLPGFHLRVSDIFAE